MGATSAVAAAKGGASRVELCSNVAEGGTTPSAGAIGAAAAALGPYSTTLHVLVRPRAGDFVYDGLEIDEMRRDISAAATAGAHGVVRRRAVAGVSSPRLPSLPPPQQRPLTDPNPPPPAPR